LPPSRRSRRTVTDAELTHDTRPVAEEPGRTTYRVRFTTTRPHFGGERWWFRCPRTWERVSKLYLPLGGREFWSRGAYRLGYGCQRESRRDRLLRRARKINLRLGGDGCLWGIPDKPKGMHGRTYERLALRLLEAERRIDESMLPMLARWMARYGAP